MLSDSDQKKIMAAILRGQESAASLKAIIDPNLYGHVDTILDSFSACLSLFGSSSPQSHKKRKRKRYGEEEEVVRDSPTLIIDDDGFSWRKYGQKFIKNSPHQRNYYRCSDGDCNGRKHVQKIQDSPPIFRTTYFGEHTCQSQAQVFLHSAHDNGNGSSPDSINLQKNMAVPVINEGYSGDYELLNDDKFWVSDFDMLPCESDVYFDRFQV